MASLFPALVDMRSQRVETRTIEKCIRADYSFTQSSGARYNLKNGAWRVKALSSTVHEREVLIFNKLRPCLRIDTLHKIGWIDSRLTRQSQYFAILDVNYNYCAELAAESV